MRECTDRGGRRHVQLRHRLRLCPTSTRWSASTSSRSGLISLLFYRAWRAATFAKATAGKPQNMSIVALPIASGLVVGTLEEWFQWLIPNRVGEARDVLLNLMDDRLWHFRLQHRASWHRRTVFVAAPGREPDPRDVLRAGPRQAVLCGAGGQPLAALGHRSAKRGGGGSAGGCREAAAGRKH